MSQLLRRLQQELSTATDPLVKAELLARISGNLARIGKFDEARRCVVELRREYAGEKSGPATVWIMLAEGLIHLYCDLNPLAIDRIHRAQMLGLAMKYSAAIAEASAWKAHIEFENSKFDAMIRSIRVGLQHAAVDDHSAQVRLAMVLANAFMISGDRASSQQWFTKARGHAVKNGDQASIEALLYNRTAFGIASVRSECCLDNAPKVDLAIVRKEVESTTNLQLLTGAAALTNHIQLWSARLSILECNFSQAIDSLANARRGAPFADYNFSQQMIDLEMAYCLAQTDQVEKSLLVFNEIDFESMRCLDLDEQLVGAFMQIELEKLSARFKRSAETQARFERLKLKYLSDKKSLLDSLREWSSQ